MGGSTGTDYVPQSSVLNPVMFFFVAQVLLFFSLLFCLCSLCFTSVVRFTGFYTEGQLREPKETNNESIQLPARCGSFVSFLSAEGPNSLLSTNYSGPKWHYSLLPTAESTR